MTPNKLELRKVLGKLEIIEATAQKLGCSRSESRQLLEIVLGFIKKKLQKGYRVQLSHFGIFTIKNLSKKPSKNVINYPESLKVQKGKGLKNGKAIVFKPGKDLERRRSR